MDGESAPRTGRVIRCGGRPILMDPDNAEREESERDVVWLLGIAAFAEASEVLLFQEV